MLKKGTILILLSFFFNTKLLAQDFIGHFAFGVQAGANLPLGISLASQQPEKMGLAWGLNFKYFPSDRFAMGVSVRSLRSTMNTSPQTYQIPLSHTAITVLAEHYFNAEGTLRPYIGLELGISVNNLQMPVFFQNQQYVPNPYSSFLGVGKVGLAYQVNDTWSFVAEGTISNFFDPGDTSFWKANDGAVFSPVKRTLTGTLGIVFHLEQMGTVKGGSVHKHIHKHQ